MPVSFARVDPALPRHDWTLPEVEALFALPFTELVFQAASAHRRWFDPAEVQRSQLLSVKTGGCAEDCGYCSQSAKFDTGLAASKLMQVDAVVSEARAARDGGAQRFCMGAAWRELKDRDLPQLSAMISGVKALGLETCATLGMLTQDQADALKEAGLDYYNHNLDTGPEYYGQVVTTRTYQDRLDTLSAVRQAGVNVCCGGIVGMGETRRDRASLLHSLATLPAHPDSLPVNALVPIKGTPGLDALRRTMELNRRTLSLSTCCVSRLPKC
jgi:biotin synthase